MAISPIGNITYINQNTQANVATTRQHEAIPTITQEFEDKLKNIEETRPTEETNTINKDSDKQNKQDFKEQKGKQHKKEKIQEDEEITQLFPHYNHILDIKV